MKTKLTDVFIQKHKIKDGERIEIFDTQVQGFGVRIGSRERAFFFVRRVKGRKVRMSLGVYPVVNLAKARSQALSILDRIKAGEDPTPELKRRKPQHEPAEDGLFGRAVEICLNQYCRGKKTPLRARTIAEYERHLTRGKAPSYIFLPELGQGFWYNLLAFINDPAIDRDPMRRGIFKQSGSLVVPPREALP